MAQGNQERALPAPNVRLRPYDIIGAKDNVTSPLSLIIFWPQLALSFDDIIDDVVDDSTTFIVGNSS